jgi:hypothetical protein
MKLSISPSLPSRSGSVRIVLIILSLVLSGGIAIAQPAPSKTKTPAKAPETTPTPNPKLDPKTEAELLQAEDRLIMAIQNGDAKALGELLDDHYADTFADAKKAMGKRGALVFLKGGRLPFYRVEKEQTLSRRGDTFIVEGLGKEGGRETSDDHPKEEWVRVRRVWTKSNDHWLLYSQVITTEEQREAQKKAEQEREAKEKQPN